MAVGTPTASAAPWSCDAFGYLFQSPNGQTATPHDVFKVDLATGQFTTTSSQDYVNAVGYNVLDNYMYGMDPNLGGLVRINSDLTFDPIALLPGPGGVLPPTDGPVGEVDPQGHYWFAAAGNWYEIDLTTTPAATVLRSGALTLPAGLSGGADWSWINGALYAVAEAGAPPSEAHLLRFDPATGSYSDVTPAGLGFNIQLGVGATYTDGKYLYASDNGGGNIYRVDPVTHQVLPVSSTNTTTGLNDGVRCAAAPIPTITVTKTVDGRVRAADQFTVGLLKPGGAAATSATTSGTATSVSTTNFPASQGKTYTITDAMAAGSASPLSEYVVSIVCKDGAGNVVATGGGTPSWTLNVASATDYTCNVTNRAEADLEIDKSASPVPSVPGTNETYSFKVTNHGPSTATNVKVTDPLPSALTFVSASSGCGEANGTVTCSASALAPGASKTFTVTAKIASSADSCSELRNTATVTSDIADNDLTNNSSSYCPPPKRRSDLSMSKTASQTQVGPGGQVMYTLVVHDDGPRRQGRQGRRSARPRPDARGGEAQPGLLLDHRRAGLVRPRHAARGRLGAGPGDHAGHRDVRLHHQRRDGQREHR